MKYLNLGASELQVSRICLGCTSFGERARGNFPSALDDDAARRIFTQALDAGITFFDTTNTYSGGSSEEITGRILLSMAKRKDVVIATKVGDRVRPGPNGQGLSRAAIMTEIDHSLRRLGTDYIDLYQIQRWDADVPIEETLEALHDLVTAGKVRYLGASSTHAWQLSKALYLAQRNGWSRFVSVQTHYNLLYREEEREMLPMCLDQGVGVLPWDALAADRILRAWATNTAHTQQDDFADPSYGNIDQPVIDAVSTVAAARSVPAARISVAWLLAQPAVTAPIVAATTTAQLDEAVAAVELVLTGEDIHKLSAVYTPHRPVGME